MCAAQFQVNANVSNAYSIRRCNSHRWPQEAVTERIDPIGPCTRTAPPCAASNLANQVRLPRLTGWSACWQGKRPARVWIGQYRRTVNDLQAGQRYGFADWPNEYVPRRAAGVYTVWRGDQLIYVGMSGRGGYADDFAADSGPPGKAKALWTRLNSHASGRRSGDQFNIYICDRFIVPVLTPDQQHHIGTGNLLLDQMTREFIRSHLCYRYLICPDGATALAAEREMRAGGLPAGRPYLNPL